MKLDTPGPPGEVWITLRSPESDFEYEAGPVTAVIRKALGEHIPADSDVTLCFQHRPGPDVPPSARMVNAREEFGWVEITVSVRSTTTYQETLAVQQLFAPTLTEIADALEPGQLQWTFEISHPDDSRPVTFRAPLRARSVSAEPGRVLTVRRLNAGQHRHSACDGDGLGDGIDDWAPTGPIAIVIDIVTQLDLGGSLASRLGVRPAPQVEHSMEVDPDRARGIGFKLRKEPEPDLPVFDPGEQGMDAGELDSVNVLLPDEVGDMLYHSLRLSGHVEEGGFLLGQVYRCADDGTQHLVRINQVLAAEHSGASWVHFTFTGDSFYALGRTLAAQETDRLVGWWHTHPHGIGVSMGLSSTDVELHHTTFRQPWQIAGLINVHTNWRKVRFYYSNKDSVKECPVWYFNERNGYRRTSPGVGDRRSGRPSSDG